MDLMSYSKISTVRDFFAALRSGPYTSLGSYPLYFATRDGEVISFRAAKENAADLARGIRDGAHDRVEFVAINYESRLYCSATSEPIESAYGCAEESDENAEG